MSELLKDLVANLKLSRWLAAVFSFGLIGCAGDGGLTSSTPANISSSVAVSSSATSLPLSSSASSQSLIATSSSSTSSSIAIADCTSFEPVLAALTSENCIACHGETEFNNFGGGLNLESGNVGERLLQRKTANTNAACAEDVLISQTNPEQSLLLQLVHADNYAALSAQGCNRNPMPFTAKTDSSRFMSSENFACLTEWVEHVAATETPITQPPPVAEEFIPADTGSALAKAKYILHGGAVTAAELDAVGGSQAQVDSADLINVIKTWEQTPEYEIKIKEFLADALQQRQLGSSAYLNQFRNITRTADGDRLIDPNLLRANVIDTFVRTAWRIHQGGNDFRNVISTRDWEVTTALLAALSFADRRNAAGEEGLLRANPYLTEADYNDWRTVKLTQGNSPAAYGNTESFVQNLRAIGDGGTLALQFPRVGFFSSPVFLNAWETNEDNQFRLTINQTLIVALGKTFEPADATTHISEAGIPEEHAIKGTVCYQCHRHMDPMRLVFDKYMYTFYRAKTADNTITPSFSFYGVTQDFDTTDQFANILKNHPELPAGWVQKLCSWGISTPCDAKDPEFKRLVNVFINNNFNMKILMRQFFSSPLFTGATETLLDQNGDALVSMSRSNHFCRAIDARIKQINSAAATVGGTDICRNQRLGLVPDDLYSRAEIDLVQTTKAGLFEAKSIDRECSRVSYGLFGIASENRLFDRDQPVADNLSYLTQFIMGIPPNHHRYAEAFAGLQRIYNLSNKPSNCADPLSQGEEITCGFGVNKRESLKAAWFAACTSPTLTGVGM